MTTHLMDAGELAFRRKHKSGKTSLPWNSPREGTVMTYCELWLISEKGMSSFRVALLAPDDFELPEGFTLAENQIDPDKKLYLSDPIDGIKAAKESIEAAAKFYSDRDLKFLFFREIRKQNV
jgi:hypothetical protein